jgi:outer membrane receptor protein involved in Fe transport
VIRGAIRLLAVCLFVLAARGGERVSAQEPVETPADSLEAVPEPALAPPADSLGAADTLRIPPDTLAVKPDTLRPARGRPTSEVFLSPEILVEVGRLGAGELPAGRLPYSTQVIPGDEIREEASLTVADALTRLPGVTAADQFGSPYQPDIRLRGFAVSPVVGLPQSISVFVDGVRVNEPDASQVQFDLIPLDDVERLEVVRGPGGPFGRNTLAAAVNIATRRGEGPFTGEIEAGGGSFERLEGRAQASGSEGSFDYYLSGRYHDTEGWRQESDALLRQGFAKLGLRHGGTDAWVSYTFADNDIRQPGSLPTSWLEGGPLPERFQGVDDPLKINFTGGDFYRPELHFVNAGLTQSLSPSVTLSADAYGRFLDVEQFNANISEPDSRGLTDVETGGATAQLTLRPAPEGLVVSAGAEYVRHDVDIRIFEAPNEFFPDIEEELTEHVGTEEENAGVFGQMWWPVTDRLALTGSLRFDHVHVPFLDFLAPEDSGTNDFDEPSGLVGVDYLVGSRASVFASYGRGFRAPVILEITCSDPEDPCPLPFELGADPPIDAVKADSWQAGARYLSESLNVETVAYWTEVYDDIYNVILPPSTRGFFQNLDRTRRVGADLTVSASPAEWIALNAGLALTGATFRTRALLASALLEEDEDEGTGGDAVGLAGLSDGEDDDGDGEGGPTEVQPGDEFSMVPNVSANLGLDLEAGDWSLSLDGSLVGSQWLVGDESNVRPGDKLDPYVVIGASAERSFGRVTAFAIVENLLDAEYETFGIVATNPLGPGDPEAVDPFLTPGLPLRVYAGLRYGW